jgi:phosphatidate cytidylyltransferase
MRNAALGLRLLTVAVLLPVFLAALWFLPNAWWALLLLIVLLLAGREWARLAAFGKPAELRFQLLLTAGCVLLWFAGGRGEAALIERTLYAVSAAFWCVVAPLCLWRKCRIRGLAALCVGLIMLLPAWLALTRMQHQPLELLLLLGVVWLADSAAYFCGVAFGRHKLAPAISPGKTWEGVVGAFAGVALYAWALGSVDNGKHGVKTVIVTCLVMTALGIIGDLFESLCKRQAGIKDSGKLLPGHGGILDRIDGLVAALPVAALMLA